MPDIGATSSRANTKVLRERLPPASIADCQKRNSLRVNSFTLPLKKGIRLPVEWILKSRWRSGSGKRLATMPGSPWAATKVGVAPGCWSLLLRLRHLNQTAQYYSRYDCECCPTKQYLAAIDFIILEVRFLSASEFEHFQTPALARLSALT